MKTNLGRMIMITMAMVFVSGCIPTADKPPVETDIEVSDMDGILGEFENLDFSDDELDEF
jgi:hypothetical protein